MIEEEPGEGQGQPAQALPCVVFPPRRSFVLCGPARAGHTDRACGASLPGPPAQASAASHGASPQVRPGSRAAEQGSGLGPSDPSLWVKFTLHHLPSLLLLGAELRVVGAQSQGPLSGDSRGQVRQPAGQDLATSSPACLQAARLLLAVTLGNSERRGSGWGHVLLLTRPQWLLPLVLWSCPRGSYACSSTQEAGDLADNRASVLPLPEPGKPSTL